MKPRRLKPEKAQGPRFKWVNIEAAEETERRAFRLETLASATEGQLRSGHGFFFAAAQTLLGPPPLTGFLFELVHEDSYRVMFRVAVTNAVQKRASLLFTAAKNSEAYSKLLETEWTHLNAVAKRAPKFVPRPLRAGWLYLPDRYRRKEMDRKVFTCVSQYPGAFEVLGPGKETQFAAHGEKKRLLNKTLCDAIRMGIGELLAASYDPAKNAGLDPGFVDPGDLWITTSPSGTPRVWLGACRRMATRLTNDRFVHKLIHASWKNEPFVCPLAPPDAESVQTALVNAVGQEAAEHLLSRYRNAVAAGKEPKPPEQYRVLLG